MKYFLTTLTVLLISSSVLMAERVNQCTNFYKKNKEVLLRKSILISDGFVYTVGVARKIGGEDTSQELAEASSFAQLVYVKRIPFERLCRENGIKNILCSNLFNAWLNLSNHKYVAKNRIELDSFTKGQYIYYIAAYREEDIVFEDKSPITWVKIYNDFKNNPDKRDELLFYEIIPENELTALNAAIEHNIARQCGRNFSLMFMNKTVMPVSQKKYDTAKRFLDKYNVNTDLKNLLIVADSIPYENKICILLSEKFEKMQMPRCAKIMKSRAEEKGKFIVESSTQSNVDASEQKKLPKKTFSGENQGTDTKNDQEKKSIPDINLTDYL